MSGKNQEVRNVAIIAHVDHGKTTLVDQLLHQSGIFRENEQVNERVLDSNDLERERGITILAKTTAVEYEGVRINILDTPGHSDFGGEVERIMNMVDGALLLVDAFEGCMPQTKFVLKKALDQGVTPILVVNKIDRENARPEQVLDEVYDLFIDLDAAEEQLDFPVIYTSAINGTSGFEPAKQQKDMKPLFETIIKHIPAPEADADGRLQLQVTMLDYDNYLGRIGIGRVYSGRLKKGQAASLMKRDGTVKPVRISRLFGFEGLERKEIDEAVAGDIVAVAGINDIYVGETVSDAENPQALPLLEIDEPTVKMTFSVNTSPFAGREGKHVTSRKLKERLLQELETDVSLKVEETESGESFVVSGRGELHLSILIENLRREGFELQVSKPEVIVKEVDGVRCEPYEYLVIDVPEDYAGVLMESLGERKAEMLNMVNNGMGNVRLEYSIPARSLIGYRTEFLTQTKGYGLMYHSFDGYKPAVTSALGGRRAGVLVSTETGTATTYAMMALEDRGTMFVEPGTSVYEGMIVGEHNRENDLVVNVCKEKHVTNIRSATKEETAKMKKPKILTLEEALEYINHDEFVEVTPQSVRLRKQYLKKSERERMAKKQPHVSS